jgi:predicted enzyme related to lactoylglutathione lyase
MPSHWLPYFAVTDPDATVAKAKRLGGRAMVEPKDIPAVGRMAILKDPQGAEFAILKPSPDMK